jgi:hypothetical protein
MTSYEKLSKAVLNSSAKQTELLRKMVNLGANPIPSAISVAFYIRNDNRAARLVKFIATCGPSAWTTRNPPSR